MFSFVLFSKTYINHTESHARTCEILDDEGRSIEY